MRRKPAGKRNAPPGCLTTELCRAVKLNKNMNKPYIKACPFCGEEWCSTRNAGNNGVLRQVYCRDADCGARGPARPSEDHAICAWNNRAGDRQPVTPETVGVKALASATGSGAGVESGDITVICERCGGQGWYPWFDGLGRETHQEQCESCYGTGRVEKAKPQPNAGADLQPRRKE